MSCISRSIMLVSEVPNFCKVGSQTWSRSRYLRTVFISLIIITDQNDADNIVTTERCLLSSLRLTEDTQRKHGGILSLTTYLPQAGAVP